MDILQSFSSLLILLVQYELMSGTEAIVDGKATCSREFSFQVSLQKISKNNKHFCGGTLVEDNWVLTAAHCVAYQAENDIRIVAGVTRLKSKLTDKNVRKIAKVFINPEYNRPLPRDNDIALIKLDKSYKLDNEINKATLVAANYRAPKDQIVYFTGWGTNKASSTTPSNKLKKTKVQVIDRAECVEKYKGKLTVGEKVFCTVHNVNKNRGVCSGDSGGPVTNNKTILVGVITANYAIAECGDENFPDIHDEVAKYRQWIDYTIAAQGCLGVNENTQNELKLISVSDKGITNFCQFLQQFLMQKF